MSTPIPPSAPRATIRGLFDDAVLLLLVVFLFPLVVLLVGAPIAVFAWVVAAIAHRL